MLFPDNLKMNVNIKTTLSIGNTIKKDNLILNQDEAIKQLNMDSDARRRLVTILSNTVRFDI